MNNKRSAVYSLAVGIPLLFISSRPLALRAEPLDAYPSTVQGVLEKYLQEDSEAAGLSPATWPEIARYVTWPDAPGWDNFVVIDHYSIEKVMEGHTRAQATVTYQPLGEMSDKFTPDTKPEEAVYHLNRVQDRWKVDGPQLPPHVSFEVMKRRLEAASSKDPKVKKTNDALIAQITAARQGLH